MKFICLQSEAFQIVCTEMIDIALQRLVYCDFRPWMTDQLCPQNVEVTSTLVIKTEVPDPPKWLQRPLSTSKPRFAKMLPRQRKKNLGVRKLLR